MIDIEIFKAGSWVSSSGQRGTYSADDLQEIAESYNPALHGEAPIVAGHPTDNSPAYGWVKSLKRMGDKLIASVGDLQPQLVDAVRQRMYKYVSVALRGREHPANPTPGKLSLVHVGMVPLPAVKGLAPVQFGEHDDLLIIEFSEDTEMGEKPEKTPQQAETPAAKPPVEPASNPTPTTDYSQIEAKYFAKVVELEGMQAKLQQEFSEIQQAKQALELQAQNIAAENRKLADERKRAAAFSESVRKERATNAINKAVAEGRCCAEFAELASQLALVIPSQEKDVVAFSDESVGNATPFDAFLGLIERLPKILPAGYLADDDFKPESIQFSAPAGYEVDADSGAMYAKIMSYCSKNGLNHKNRDHFLQALTAVGGR